MKKAGIFILSLGMLMVFTSWAGAQSFKIAYVDMQKALNYCEAGKEAKKHITMEMEKMQKSFAGKQKEIEKLREDLEKRSSVLSESARREKERDYEFKMRDLQRLQRDYEDDLRRKYQEFNDRILKALLVIAKKLGEEGKYTLIVEKNQPAIIYISNAMDLTDEMIKLADQQKIKLQ